MKKLYYTTKNLLNHLTLTFVLLVLVPSPGLPQNFLSTEGDHLIDANGNEVRLTGVNWFGFETNELVPHGLWARDLESMLIQIKDQGFNCIRIPWCNAMLAPGATASVNSFGTDPYTGVSPMNAEAATKSQPIEIMDIIVEWCQENDMKIILDNHSRAPGAYMEEDLWYTSAVPESQWIDDWVFMTNRYKNYDAVIGMDLNNEPHDRATWGNSNPATDWNKAAERCGNAILAVNPNVLILVEGTEEHLGDVYWWGGNLIGAAQYPVQLNVPNKLMYSPHEYGPTVFPQDWFTDPAFPSNMPGIWDEHFGYLYNQDISPLLIGEFGIRDSEGADEIWFDSFLEYMGNDYSWTFWCWNPNSGDTGGLLDYSWVNIVDWKMEKLTPYLAPMIPNGNVGPPADELITSTSSISFSASSASSEISIQSNISWTASTSTSWISLSPTSGSGNGTLTVSVTENTDSTARSGNITLTGNDIVRTIEVSQNASSSDSLFLTLSPQSLEFEAGSATASLSISSNISWAASTTVSWITISPATGSGSGNIDISVSANTSSERSAEVIVSGEGISASVTISQAEADNEGPCSNATEISLPFTHEGSGNFCWITSDNISYVNSWNMEQVEINGSDYTNTWSNTMPTRINGSYYIHYVANFAYSHLEINANTSNARLASDQIKDTSLKIYPNPTAGAITIQTDKYESLQVIIYDTQGRLTYEETLNNVANIHTIEPKIAPGLYTLQVLNNSEIIHSEQVIFKD
ncbi:cellulase family glycosylhydrolase [Fulvivirga maritima]|uniref:cellulase family glycosylhydrolase n=1 Tax=Fulvivirga maritima TaxID=2904247 RepID=UPI001F46F643|nr:cellulase family glycosylhydrolase [Fulvivirga maritima]UII27504.1 cellulase family glycosylhydrolase [Fulvivirga maritima]